MMIYLQMIETKAERTRFERIYDAYKELMYHIAFEILQQEQDAEDAVHLAFISIAENIGVIEEPGPRTKRYAAVITENKAVDIRRKRQRLTFCSLEEEAMGIPVKMEDGGWLAACINQLPALQRQVIWLKYDCGYNLREIAKMLRISYAWACKLDQRAKIKLREICIREGYQP